MPDFQILRIFNSFCLYDSCNLVETEDKKKKQEMLADKFIAYIVILFPKQLLSKKEGKNSRLPQLIMLLQPVAKEKEYFLTVMQK